VTKTTVTHWMFFDELSEGSHIAEYTKLRQLVLSRHDHTWGATDRTAWHRCITL